MGRRTEGEASRRVPGQAQPKQRIFNKPSLREVGKKRRGCGQTQHTTQPLNDRAELTVHALLNDRQPGETQAQDTAHGIGEGNIT